MPKKGKGKKKSSSKEPPSTKPPPDPSDHYVRVFQMWAKSNITQIMKLCEQLNTGGDNPGALPVEQFLGSLFDLKAPLARGDLQKICQFFTKVEFTNSSINYVQFKDIVLSGQLALLYTEPTESSTGDDKPMSSQSSSEGISRLNPLKMVRYQCPDCYLLRTDIPVEVNPNVVHIKFVLASFHHTPSHPGHFSATVLSSQSIQGLKMLITDHLHGSVRSVAVFKDLPCVEANFMRPNHEIQRYLPSPTGDQGSTQIMLYYDYAIECEQDAVVMAENGLFNIKSSGLPVKKL